jgi:hypothetical protein
MSIVAILRPMNIAVKSVLHINTEVVVLRLWSSNGFYGPGETYTLAVEQLP